MQRSPTLASSISTRTIAISLCCAFAFAAGGCEAVLGLGDFKDCCPPIGNGDKATCVDCSANGGAGTTSASNGGGGTHAGGGGAGGKTGCAPGEMQDCYDGMPASTEGKGACKGGQQTCDGTGHFGKCEEEVVPSPETCASKKDEDCDGFDCILWATQIEADPVQEMHAVATDSKGNIFVVGNFEGSITVAGQQHVSVGYVAGQNGTSDILLIKVDPSGKPLWAKTYGNAGQQIGTAIAVDPSDNVIIGGTYYASAGDTSTFSLGGGTEVGTGMFVAKYTSDGDYIWSQSLGGYAGYPGDNGSVVASIAVGADSSIVIGGSFWDSVNFGHGPVSAPSHPSAFFGKLTDTGSAAPGSWPIVSGDVGGSAQYVTSVGVTTDERIVVGGYFTGALSLGFPGTVNASDGAMFITNYTATGATQGRANFGTGQLTNLAVQPDGDYFVGGNFTGDLKWDGNTLATATTNGSAFVMKVQYGLDPYWTLKFGDTAGVTGLAVGSEGSVHVSGYFTGPTTLAGERVAPGAGESALIARLTKSGAMGWFRGFAPHPTMHLAADPQDNTVLAGIINNPVDLGNGTLKATAAGGYVAKFAP
jgi:hypothetical protein